MLRAGDAGAASRALPVTVADAAPATLRRGLPAPRRERAEYRRMSRVAEEFRVVTSESSEGVRRMFRQVKLPALVPGKLLLHSMPGCFETLEQVWEHVHAEGVQAIVNLAQAGETRRKSPTYAKAILSGQVPCPVISFPVKDCGTPRSRVAFWELALDLAQRLEAGDRILVHCAAGVGRAGSLATCILVALGATPAAAAKAVWAAGSQPETDGQMELVAWCAAQRSAGR